MLAIKILFAIIILVCVIFYIMYLGDFALVLLIIMIALPIIMFIYTLITKNMISVNFAVSQDTAVKNQDFPVRIKINNRSILPVGKAEAHIEYYNVFNNQINSFELYMPIQARNSQSVTFQLQSKYCGIINIRCAYIYIFDPLRLFKFKVGKNICTDIAILPECREISGTVRFSDRVNEESEKFSEYKPGDDPSEVFDLRGYIPGDKLNRIHWKLSSKKDEFIVKDYSLPVDIPSVIFLNLKCYDDSKYTLPVFDTLVESFISVSQFLIDNERSHTVVFFNGKAGCFMEYTIDSPEALTEVTRTLIFSVNDNLFCDPPEAYLLDNTDVEFSSFTFVTSQPDNDIIGKIDDSVNAELKNVIIVVKSPREAEALNASYPETEIYPVLLGRITASIKEIEL